MIINRFHFTWIKILLHKTKKGNAWVLPGGRGEINEETGKTAIREFTEELGLNVKVARAEITIPGEEFIEPEQLLPKISEDHEIKHIIKTEQLSE